MPQLRKNPPKTAAEEIEALAATGFNKIGIAAHFGVSADLFNKWMEANGKLAEAFKRGRERERQALHNALYKKAIEKNDTVAAIFLLKARHSYREGDQSQDANKVAITFNLPGAMTPEQYALAAVAKQPKVIDANTGTTAE
jgi:hypothetical protein